MPRQADARRRRTGGDCPCMGSRIRRNSDAAALALPLSSRQRSGPSRLTALLVGLPSEPTVSGPAGAYRDRHGPDGERVHDAGVDDPDVSVLLGRPGTASPRGVLPMILGLTMEAAVVLPKVLELLQDSERKPLSSTAAIRQQVVEVVSRGFRIVPCGAQPVRDSRELRRQQVRPGLGRQRENPVDGLRQQLVRRIPAANVVEARRFRRTCCRCVPASCRVRDLDIGWQIAPSPVDGVPHARVPVQERGLRTSTLVARSESLKQGSCLARTRVLSRQRDPIAGVRGALAAEDRAGRTPARGSVGGSSGRTISPMELPGRRRGPGTREPSRPERRHDGGTRQGSIGAMLSRPGCDRRTARRGRLGRRWRPGTLMRLVGAK